MFYRVNELNVTIPVQAEVENDCAAPGSSPAYGPGHSHGAVKDRQERVAKAELLTLPICPRHRIEGQSGEGRERKSNATYLGTPDSGPLSCISHGSS